MFYKLSNTATRHQIEREFDVTFEFPKLYQPTAVINGLEETLLPIVTTEKPGKVNFAIWGLLPKALEENWDIFQHLTNTLNVNVEHLDSNNPVYSEALDNRRCLIITTGFFVSALFEGRMYPYHVYLEDHKPFAIAGVYNQLQDGFLTCSILIKKTDDSLREVPNLLNYKPVIFDKRDGHHWLNNKFKYENLKDLVLSHQTLQYYSHPISKEFYDNDMLYKEILKSNSFNGIVE